MKIEGIDHVEFYVADADRSATELRDGYGFTICGRSGPGTRQAGYRSVLTRQGAITILFTSAEDPGHPAAGYAGRHGDGPAVIAYSVTDAGACFAEAVQRGAAPVSPPSGQDVASATVSGFGDVAHRFVARRDPAGPFAPGLITEIAAAAAAPAGLQCIDHITICVEPGQMAATAWTFHDVLDFSQTFAEQVTAGGQVPRSIVMQNPSDTVTISLLEPPAGSCGGQAGHFLAAHGGSGIQRIAFRTPDIFGAVRDCARRGVRFQAVPGSYYDALPARVGPAAPLSTLRDLGVLADRDGWGLMFQAFAESAHSRRTFSYQLVERRGALTFGTHDAPALCAAAHGQG